MTQVPIGFILRPLLNHLTWQCHPNWTSTWCRFKPKDGYKQKAYSIRFISMHVPKFLTFTKGKCMKLPSWYIIVRASKLWKFQKSWTIQMEIADIQQEYDITDRKWWDLWGYHESNWINESNIYRASKCPNRWPWNLKQKTHPTQEAKRSADSARCEDAPAASSYGIPGTSGDHHPQKVDYYWGFSLFFKGNPGRWIIATQMDRNRLQSFCVQCEEGNIN